MPEDDSGRPGQPADRPGQPAETLYDVWLKSREAFADRQLHGKVVVKAADLQFEANEQGRLRFYLHSLRSTGTVLDHWMCFNEKISDRSGRHIHQGGNCMFVLEGRGHSVFDGERVDWEAGDLIIVPLRPGGSEHQHFNDQEGSDYLWLAFVFMPWFDLAGSEMTQYETTPAFES